jgi:tetratricopeptide (TPR) repeat protein
MRAAFARLLVARKAPGTYDAGAMAKKIKIRKEETAEEALKVDEEKKLAEQGIQDEFQAKGFELVEWVQENRPVVVGILVGILLLGFAYAGWTLVRTSRDVAAGAAYAEALKAYDAPLTVQSEEKADGPRFKDAAERARTARDLFGKVVDQHGGTGAATLARLYIGNASLKLDEPDAAIAAFEGFLKDASRSDPLRFAGLSGLAAAREAKGDVDGAIQALEEQVELPGRIDEDGALLALGRLYAKKGDAGKARTALERIGKDFPESPLRARADELLGAVSTGATPPPAMPAPTPAPTPASPTP